MRTFLPKTVTQIAFVVDDIEAYLRRFARLFNVETPAYRVTNPYEQTHLTYKGQPSTTARAKLGFIQLENITLEFIEPIGGPSIWRDFLEKHGPGVQHIAFEVNSAQTIIAAFEEEGIPLGQTSEFTGGRAAYLAVQAILGCDIELLEHDQKE